MPNSVVTLRKVLKFEENPISRSSYIFLVVFTSSKTKIRNLHKFATTNSILKKSIILDIHHNKTHMYVNFQQTWANRSVITVHTNVFTKKSQVA